MNILAFAASLRSESYNKKLLNLAVEIARNNGVSIDLADFHEFEMPMYDADLEDDMGLPDRAHEMVRRIEAADGIIIASPEYNSSLPGTLKNAIDWVSRANPMPLRGKSGLLLAASTSMVGGIRGLWQLRIPLEALGVFVYPDMFALSSSQHALTDDGKIRDGVLAKRLENLISSYIETARRLQVTIPAY